MHLQLCPARLRVPGLLHAYDEYIGLNLLGMDRQKLHCTCLPATGNTGHEHHHAEGGMWTKQAPGGNISQGMGRHSRQTHSEMVEMAEAEGMSEKW